MRDRRRSLKAISFRNNAPLTKLISDDYRFRQLPCSQTKKNRPFPHLRPRSLFSVSPHVVDHHYAVRPLIRPGAVERFVNVICVCPSGHVT